MEEGSFSSSRAQSYVSNCYTNPPRRNQAQVPSCTAILPAFLTHLNSNCLNLPFGTQGRSRRWKHFSYKQEMGDKERCLYLGWKGKHRILHSFKPPFSLILLHLEGWQRTSVVGGLGFTTTLGGLSIVSTSVLPANCHFPK